MTPLVQTLSSVCGLKPEEACKKKKIVETSFSKIAVVKQPIYSKIAVFFPDFSPWISQGTFPILLLSRMEGIAAQRYQLL